MSDYASPMPETVQFDLDSQLYGAGLLANVVAGAWIQAWYTNWIKNQSILFPADDEDNNQDEEWALNTNEISNWSTLCKATVGMYGLHWVIWAINLSIGNDGSLIHKLFFMSMLVQRYVPMVSLYLIFKLNASYLPTDASYSYWSSLTTVVATPDKMEYLFNPGQTANTVNNYDDPTWINRRWIMFFAAVFSFAATNYSFKSISMEYFIASAMADMMKEADQPTEEAVEEVVEEAVAEEEIFF